MHEVKLIINGLASGSNQTIVLDQVEADMNLMDFLRSRSVSIASSCYGEGICKKCILSINGEKKMSCQVPMSFFKLENTNQIEIDYL